MANLIGFPNEQVTVMQAPLYFEELTNTNLEGNAFLGMPVGTTIVVGDFEASGNGTYAMKMRNQFDGGGDWMALGGTFIDAGNWLD